MAMPQNQNQSKLMPDSFVCQNCGSKNFLFNEYGEQNEFCGHCGHRIDWTGYQAQAKQDWNDASNWAIMDDSQKIMEALQASTVEYPKYPVRTAVNTFLAKVESNKRFQKAEKFLIIPIFSKNLFNSED